MVERPLISRADSPHGTVQAGSVQSTDDDLFVARYVPSSDHYNEDVPTLETSLSAFARLPDLPRALQALAPTARCLFQGYTAPCNADALRRFLLPVGITRCDIVAVDLLDLPAIYGRLGVAMPEVDFLQADACALSGRLEGRRFNLIVQDFILNASPPTRGVQLLAEAARLLEDGGLALLSFTECSDLSGCLTLTPDDLSARWGLTWDPERASLAALAGSPHRLAEASHHLIGTVIVNSTTGHYTFVTAPSGRFEFYVPAEQTLATLAAVGFETLMIERQKARDYNGLDCNRYRCVVRRAESLTP